MGFRLDVRRCLIFDEFSPELQNKYFGLTRDKVIFNIDTLYYTVSLYENEENVTCMLDLLSEWKSDYNSGNKDIKYGDMFYRRFCFSIYEHCLTIDNMFDIFISSYLPNKNTPRIVIQLRSIGLWQKGTEEMIKYSLDNLKQFLAPFNIKIDKVKVNRIDYAYHSNLIQNTSKYLNDKVLLKNLNSKLRIYQKVGNITDTVEVDYFSLGNRKSNNIFFRTYNKCREVVEQNYKGFFIDIWHKQGLISEYDKYCLEQGYKYGSYTSMNIARIDWYLKNGTNEELKERLREIREKCFINSDNYTYIKKALRNVLPEVTVIMNVEFQTKTKFFNSIEGIISQIPIGSVADVAPELRQLTKIIRNSRIITDYLTSNTVSFVDKNKGDYLSWWLRIRQCKINSMFRGNLVREYSKNIDIDKLKQRMLTSVAGISAYKNNINSQTLTDDISDFLCVLNDNDMHNITINPYTGEKLEFNNYQYTDIKKRKQRQIKPFLEEIGVQENDT